MKLRCLTSRLVMRGKPELSHCLSAAVYASVALWLRFQLPEGKHHNGALDPTSSEGWYGWRRIATSPNP